MPWWIEPKRPLARRLSPTAPQRGNGPHNGMGADFDQQHGKQVGERTRCRRRRAALVTETGPVLCRICHSELGSINTHQAQTKRETARGLLLSKGTADPLEELTKDAHAQQATTVAEGSRGRSGVAVVLAAEAPGAQEAITHLPQRTLCHHAPSDQQVDHDQVIELAFPLLLGPILVKQVGNHRAGIDLFKHRKGQQMAKLVSGDDLRYSWQGRELLLTSLLVFFSMSDLELPLPLFKWYWPQAARREKNLHMAFVKLHKKLNKRVTTEEVEEELRFTSRRGHIPLDALAPPQRMGTGIREYTTFRLLSLVPSDHPIH